MNRRRLLWLAGLVTGLAGCRLPTRRAQEEGTAPGYELLPVIRRDPFYQWQPAGLTQTSEDYSPPGIIDNNGCSLLRRWGHPQGDSQPHLDAGRAAALAAGYYQDRHGDFFNTVSAGEGRYALFRVSLSYVSRDDTIETSWYGTYAPDPAVQPDPERPSSSSQPTTGPS